MLYWIFLNLLKDRSNKTINSLSHCVFLKLGVDASYKGPTSIISNYTRSGSELFFCVCGIRKDRNFSLPPPPSLRFRLNPLLQGFLTFVSLWKRNTLWLLRYFYQPGFVNPKLGVDPDVENHCFRTFLRNAVVAVKNVLLDCSNLWKIEAWVYRWCLVPSCVYVYDIIVIIIHIIKKKYLRTFKISL